MRLFGLPGLIACACLAGCGAIVPDQPNFSSNLILPKTASGAATTPQYTSHVEQLEPGSCAKFDSDASPSSAERNECVAALMQDIDDAYYHYEITVTDSIGATNATLDFANTATSAAATATSGTTAKILSGIATVASGAKGVIDQDLLYKDTVQMLISTMRADRAKDAAKIKLALQQTLTAYPMYEAKSDLLQYLYDGTLTNALVDANQNASSTAQKCQSVKTAVNAAVNAAAETGAKVTQKSTTATAASSATTTSEQCSQLAASLSYAFDTSAAASSIDAILAANGAVNKAGVSAVIGCLKSTTPPADVDVARYTLPNGSLDPFGFSADSTIDQTYKAQVLACAKAAVAKGP